MTTREEKVEWLRRHRNTAELWCDMADVDEQTKAEWERVAAIARAILADYERQEHRMREDEDNG